MAYINGEIIVFVNTLGYCASPFISDATIPIKTNTIEANKITSTPGHMAWRVKDGDLSNHTFELVPEPTVEGLRFARAAECFPIANRGALWYASLTAEQQAEVMQWYKDWLDITETGVIPEKPDWLV